MTYNNSHPLANPLNSSRMTNFNIGRAQSSSFISHTSDTKSLQVPNRDVPLFGTLEWEARYNQQKNLKVPNQDIPLGDQLRGSGFLPGNDNLFKISDGTIIDFKTGRILRRGSSFSNSQYWGNPNEEITLRTDSSSHDREDEFSELIAMAYRVGEQQKSISQMNSELDQQSIDYWLKAQEEAEKLKANMTQKQLDAIADFEKHFPKSKLVEESKRLKETKLMQ